MTGPAVARGLAPRPIQRAPIRASRLAWHVDIAEILRYAGLSPAEVQRAVGALIGGDAPSLSADDVAELAVDIIRVSHGRSALPAPSLDLDDDDMAEAPRRGLVGGWESFAA